MSKATRNAGTSWTDEDTKQLHAFIRDNTPTSAIAKAMRRTTAAVRSKAQKEGVSLRAAAASTAATVKGAVKGKAKKTGKDKKNKKR